MDSINIGTVYLDKYVAIDIWRPFCDNNVYSPSNLCLGIYICQNKIYDMITNV